MTSRADIRPNVWAAFRGCRLWRTASDDAVVELARRSRVTDVARGAHLATEGEPADQFGLIVAGKARVFYLGADGRQITFETVETGQPFAAVGSLAGSRYPANVEAATPATIAFVPADALFALLDAEPSVARTLIADLANRVVNFTAVVTTLSLDAFKRLMRDEPDVMMSVISELARQMTDMVTMVKTLSADVPARVAIYIGLLLEEQEPVGPGPFTVDLGVPRVELAARLGTVPETLSRAFHALQDEGIIESHGHKVRVMDRDALIARSNGVL